MTVSIPLVILAPITGAVLCYLAGERARRAIAAAAAFAILASVISLAITVWRHGPSHLELGGWSSPLGIGLYADGFSLFALLMTAIVGFGITIYAISFYAPGYQRKECHEARLFWPLWFFLWSAMNALFVATDIFNIYVVFELLGISAIALITLAGKREALTAAMRYLIAAILGSLSYLLGVSLLYAEHGVLSLFLLSGLVTATPGTLAAFSLMAAGLMLKTALFPLHFWLPSAHANASAPVSAILSAIVVKGSFFVLARIWFSLFHETPLPGAGQMLGVLGAIAILWGSLTAIRQQRLKLLIAYSTVAQVGYMFLLFPLTTIIVSGDTEIVPAWPEEALSGIMYQVVSHAFAKSALFLAAGIIVMAYGTDQLRAMRGLSRVMPLTTFSFALACMSIVGLPPSGGFVAKFLLMKAAVGSGQWWWLPFIVLGGLLTAGYVVAMLRYAFQITDPPAPRKPIRRSMEIAALVLATLSVLIGLRLQEPLDLLRIGSPFLLENGGGGP